MNNTEMLIKLNEMLLCDMPEYKSPAGEFSDNEQDQQRLFRSLMNLRPPMTVSDEFLKVQDEYLGRIRDSRGVVLLDSLIPIKNNKNIYLWQGDITTLKVDAIVNAANSALLGCFIPCHSCIDNAIHSYSGVQLRISCDKLMKIQGRGEETGNAKITEGFNLPAKYVIHTVGPIINGKLRDKDRELLSKCYESCLNLAIEKKLSSIAFCCISTGEFHFPNDEAAIIAVKTVKDILMENKSDIKVIFNVFKEEDRKLYRELLGEDIKA